MSKETESLFAALRRWLGGPRCVVCGKRSISVYGSQLCEEMHRWNA